MPARTWLVCTADTLGVELRIAALKFMAWWSNLKSQLELEAIRMVSWNHQRFATRAAV